MSAIIFINHGGCLESTPAARGGTGRARAAAWRGGRGAGNRGDGGGARYGLDFAGGYSAGLFIDQRANRARLRVLKPKRLLNTFATRARFGGGGDGWSGDGERRFIAAVADEGRGEFRAQWDRSEKRASFHRGGTCWRCCRDWRDAGRNSTQSFSIRRRSRAIRRARRFQVTRFDRLVTLALEVAGTGANLLLS